MTAWQFIFDKIAKGNSFTIGQSLIIGPDPNGGVQAVPEPGAMVALFAAGSLGLGLKRKKQLVAKN